MVGNNLRKTVTANRSYLEKVTDDDLHNGLQSDYYDKPSKKKFMSEYDEHNNKNQIRATKKSKSCKKRYLTGRT